jgi:hypothetical protein
VTAKEVSPGEFKRGLSQAQRAEVDHHLAEGRGVAVYEDDRGRPVVVMTYGTKDADLPGYPPKMYGGGTLSSYVPAAVAARVMQSPATSWEPVPQVRRPRVAPSQTEHPQVLMEMRTSGHPGGNTKFITPVRYTPEGVVAPQEPEGENSWYAARLGAARLGR